MKLAIYYLKERYRNYFSFCTMILQGKNVYNKARFYL